MKHNKKPTEKHLNGNGKSYLPAPKRSKNSENYAEQVTKALHGLNTLLGLTPTCTTDSKDLLLKMSETSVLIDYAHPCMMAERALKDLHDAMLMKKYDEAIEHGLRALAEVKLTINSIKHVQEQERK